MQLTKITQALNTVWDGWSFVLPLNDAGSGAVNTTPLMSLGSSTPTFTRAGNTATTINSAGLVIPVNANIARAYYDPTTLTYRGYLAEGARTNLLLQSADTTSASWSKTDTTPTLSGTGPDGVTNSANLLTEGSAGTAVLNQVVTATADANYAVSFWAKTGNLQWIRATVQNGANLFQVFFDIQNGAVGSTVVGGTGASIGNTVKAYPNGWYRFSLVGSVGSAATAISLNISSATADGNGTRVANSTRLMYGLQFENNVSFASSYIPTTTASVTRNADVLTYAFAGNADAAAGTAYAELSTEWTSAVAIALSFATNQFPLLLAGAASTTIVSDDGTLSLEKTGLSDMSTGSRKRASSWGTGRSLTGDGLAPATGTFDGSMGSTQISIGSNVSGGQQWSGTIRNVRISPLQFSDGFLEKLTA